MSGSAQRRTLITGIGCVTPLGNDWPSTWAGICAGRSGIDLVTKFDASAFPSRIAGEVRGLTPADVVGKRDARTLDPFEIYALAAAREALADAGLEIGADAERVGVCFGVGLGGIGSMEQNHRAMLDRGPRRVSPFLVPMMIPNMAASTVSIRLGARGPCEVVTTACASGAHALATGKRWIELGLADVVIAGGAEAAVTPLAFAGFCSMRALSRRNESPATASRPFDAERDGFVLSEGSAALVLEAEDHASKREATVRAQLCGAGSTADAHHITQPEPEGRGQARCIELALRDAGLEAGDIDYINAHGTATPQNDIVETKALHRVLGRERCQAIPVSSTKSMTGHMLGAAGALEALLCGLVISEGLIPPTINLSRPDSGCELCHVSGSALEGEVEVALSNSFGFGGTNSSLLLRRWDDAGGR